MKILHAVESYYPSIGGMQEVVKQLSERLAKLGHSVTVATRFESTRRMDELNGVEIKSFHLGGNLVHGITGSDAAAYRSFVKNSQFDIVTLFAAQQWSADLLLPILDEIPSKKVFVPTGFSGLFLPEYRDYFEKMKTWLRAFDMSIFLSEDYRDINFSRQAGISAIRVIPNGAAEDEFLAAPEMDIRSELGIPDDAFLILHVGSHTGAKGHREAIEMFRLARLRNAAFLIVGNSFGHGCARSCKWKSIAWKLSAERLLSQKYLTVAALDRSRTLAAYHAADLFLFPSNIECSPIVLFEAMAAKTPFLTTDVGNASEIVQWSQGGKVLPTFKDEAGFGVADVPAGVKLLEKLYRDITARESLGEKGFLAWKERFTWEAIARQYDELYRAL